MQNIQKSHLTFLMAVTFGVLVLGLFFTLGVAQARESYEYVRTYSSDDGRSQIMINSHSSSNSNTSIRNRVSAYSNSNFATNSIHSSYENNTFSTSLTGSQEVPPVSTVTTGRATFEVDDDDDTIEYDVDVWNGEDITAAHLHCGAQGANGPVAVSLFSSSGIDVNGELESGEITDSDVTDNCTSIDDLGDLIEEMEEGDIYVNVHSTAYPDGLIRGQLNGISDDEDDDDIPPSHLIQRIEELLEVIRNIIGNR